MNRDVNSVNTIPAGASPQAGSPIRRAQEWIASHPGKSGTIAGWYQQGCGAFGQFLTFPLIIHRLSHVDQGIWFAFQVLLGGINLADFGLTFILTRQVAFSLSLREGSTAENTDFIMTHPGWRGVADVLSLSKRIFHVLGLIAAAALAVVYLVVTHFGNMVPNANSKTLAAWCLLGCGTIFSLQAKPAQAVVEGVAKVYLTRFVVGTCQLLTAAGVITCLLAGGGMVAMAGAVAAVMIVQWAALQMIAARQGPLAQFKDAPPSTGLAGKLIRVAVPMGVLNASAFAISYIQVPLLGMVLGPLIVPAFYLAQRIGQTLNLAVTQLVGPQMPLFTRELAAGDTDSSRRRMKRTLFWATLAVAAANVFLLLASPVIVKLWVGPGRYVDATTLALMSLDYLLLGSSVIWAQFVFASGRNPYVYTTTLCAAMNVGLIFLLCPHFGLVGIPLATLTSGLLTNYWYTVFTGMKLMRSLRRR